MAKLIAFPRVDLDCEAIERPPAARVWAEAHYLTVLKTTRSKLAEYEKVAAATLTGLSTLASDPEGDAIIRLWEKKNHELRHAGNRLQHAIEQLSKALRT